LRDKIVAKLDDFIQRAAAVDWGVTSSQSHSTLRGIFRDLRKLVPFWRELSCGREMRDCDQCDRNHSGGRPSEPLVLIRSSFGEGDEYHDYDEPLDEIRSHEGSQYPHESFAG
jgi:hypothetical protein